MVWKTNYLNVFAFLCLYVLDILHMCYSTVITDVLHFRIYLLTNFLRCPKFHSSIARIFNRILHVSGLSGGSTHDGRVVYWCMIVSNATEEIPAVMILMQNCLILSFHVKNRFQWILQVYFSIFSKQHLFLLKVCFLSPLMF